MTDDKGPAIAVIHAIKELLDEGVTFNKRVRIIFGQAEETGAWEDMEYYKRTKKPLTLVLPLMLISLQSTEKKELHT